MEWVLLIIILTVGYYVYKTIQQNNPETKIERLEGLADQFYPEVVKEAEKSVGKWYEQLHSIAKGKTKKYTITGQTREDVEKFVGNTEKRLKEIKDFKDNYIRLKEKNKHESSQIRLALAQDYFDYYYTRTQINNEFKHLDYADNDWADRIFEEMKELEIKSEEIVKRLGKQLA